jgi:hypothetical protein
MLQDPMYVQASLGTPQKLAVLRELGKAGRAGCSALLKAHDKVPLDWFIPLCRRRLRQVKNLVVGARNCNSCF